MMFGSKRKRKEQMKREMNKYWEIRYKLMSEFGERGEIYKVDSQEMEQKIQEIKSNGWDDKSAELFAYSYFENQYIRRRLKEMGYSEQEINGIMVSLPSY